MTLACAGFEFGGDGRQSALGKTLKVTHDGVDLIGEYGLWGHNLE